MRPRLTYANIVSSIALFLVLTGGAAYALDGPNTVFSDDIVNGEVRNADLGADAVGSGKIADQQVKNADLGPGASSSNTIADGGVRGIDVADNSLKGVDIDESTLSSIGGGGPAGGDLTGSYPNPQIAADAVGTNEVANNSLRGADIAESTLGQVPSALTATLGGLGRGGPIEDTCNPSQNGVFETCATVQLTVPPGPGARALVFGRATAVAEGAAAMGTGVCQLSTSTAGPVPDTAEFVFVPAGQLYPVDTAGITPLLGPGLHTFGIECNGNDTDNQIDYADASVQVVAISPG